VGSAVGTQANYKYYDAAGAAIAAGTVPAAAVDECDVLIMPVVVETDASDLSLDASSTHMLVDIPALNYDLDLISSADVVTIRVSLVEPPCTQIFSADIDIGTFGACAAAAIPTMVTYPYFTAMDASEAWWDGMAIVNYSTTSGTADITVYEEDGDVGTYQTTVAGNSMYVTLLSDMLGSLTQTAGTGTLGDARCYIVVTTDFNADGFGMMGEFTFGNAQGYLPRVQ
jgi:hypothetical protein